MKLKTIIGLIVATTMLFSCATVQVQTDYDTQANFNNYKTFGFYKPGIDKVEINDLDKKRILRAIDKTMQEKGFTKSENPDLLVNIKTKAEKSINVYQNTGFGYGYGWGWYNPIGWGGFYGYNTTYQTVDGVLYIDLIDAQKKELIWNGTGRAALVEGPEAKEARIQEMVSAILLKYPPQLK